MPTYTKKLDVLPHDADAGILAGTVTFGSSDTYPTNGVTIDLTKFSPSFTFSDLQLVIPNLSNGMTGYYIAGTTLANGKLKLFSASATEVVNTTSLDTVVVKLLIVTGRKLI